MMDVPKNRGTWQRRHHRPQWHGNGPGRLVPLRPCAIVDVGGGRAVQKTSDAECDTAGLDGGERARAPPPTAAMRHPRRQVRAGGPNCLMGGVLA